MSDASFVHELVFRIRALSNRTSRVEDFVSYLEQGAFASCLLYYASCIVAANLEWPRDVVVVICGSLVSGMLDICLGVGGELG